VELFYNTASTEVSALQEVKVREIMTRKVITVPPTMTVDELLDKIARHHHTGFPVTDVSNKIVGIVTLQDAMTVDKETRKSISVGDIATKDLVVAFPDDSVAEALEKMSQHNVGRLLVVDEKDRLSLMGILTRSDIMHTLKRNL
jgi:CIC family chloride channel protein